MSKSVFDKINKVMFISVHPDDETLGCGGAILRHKTQGDSIYWLNLTGPSLDHPYGFTQERIKTREHQLKCVNAAYLFERYIDLAYPTQMLETIEPRLLIGSVSKVFQEIQPNILYVPNRADIHSDHKVGFQAIYAAAKNFRSPFIEKILMYETLSETEFAPSLTESVFMPNYYIDISEYMDKKIEIMQIYDTEIMPDPLPRSIHAIKGLGAFRGSRIGVKYAESFMMIFSKV